MLQVLSTFQGSFMFINQAKFNLANPIHFLAVGFGSGLTKKAPGTFGTLAAVPLFYFASYLSNSMFLFLLILMSVIGVYLCGKAAADVGVDDHPAIVWDEFVGFFITMYLSEVTWLTLLVGFVLFRLFDILKPWPISVVDKNLHGGFGIMLDDILAGFAAMAVMLVIF
jgi:phosphatidylglycerophosphatase A